MIPHACMSMIVPDLVVVEVLHLLVAQLQPHPEVPIARLLLVERDHLDCVEGMRFRPRSVCDLAFRPPTFLAGKWSILAKIVWLPSRPSMSCADTGKTAASFVRNFFT